MFNFFTFFRKERRKLEALEKELAELDIKIDKYLSGFNNFPLFAITFIPKSQIKEIVEENKPTALRSLMGKYMADIEKHDLSVDFVFMPRDVYYTFCAVMEEDIDRNNSFWGMTVVPVVGLNTCIFISNIKEFLDEDKL